MSEYSKVGVCHAESESESVDGHDVLTIKGAVINENTLFEVVLGAAVTVGGLVDEVGAVLGREATNGEGKLAAGIHTAVQDVGNGVDRLLAWKTGPEYGGDALAAVQRVDEDRADGVDDDDGVVTED